MKLTFRSFNLIKSYLSLTSFFIITTSIAYGANNNEYKEFICKAFKETYKEGVLRYEMEYRHLDSDGDTLTIRSFTEAINSKKNIEFTSVYMDSLKLIYLNNELLYINTNVQTYETRKVKSSEIRDEVDVIYLPLLDRKFGKAICNSDAVTEKIKEDNNIVVFKVRLLNTGDIGNLYYLITISKANNTVVKYSTGASIFNVTIWDEYSLLSIEQFEDPDKGGIVAEDYSIVISNFNLRTVKLLSDNPDSMRLELAKLTTELPNYDLVSTEGDTLKISDTKSKHYLIDFWYRSCYPCIKAMSVMKELETKYSDDELRIFSINSVDTNVDNIKNFMIRNSISYKVFTSSIQRGRKFSGVHIYPFFIMYDSNFNIIASFSGYSENLQTRIEGMITN
jgi:thiol-disulfide isomerase/thioredoxin